MVALLTGGHEDVYQGPAWGNEKRTATFRSTDKIGSDIHDKIDLMLHDFDFDDIIQLGATLNHCNSYPPLSTNYDIRRNCHCHCLHLPRYILSAGFW